MVEDSLSERLKWIRDEYFRGVGAQKRMAQSADCESSYISQLIKGTRKRLGASLAENLVNSLPKNSNVTVQWLLFGGARPVAGYPEGRPQLIALREPPPEDTVLKWVLDQFSEMKLREALEKAKKEDRFNVVQALAARLDKIVPTKNNVNK